MSYKTDTAILFPGQGAHNVTMLDSVRQHPSFVSRYEVICESLGFDPLARIDAGDVELINANAVSSLFTVLASVIALDEWRKYNPEPRWIAGYSVGQLTALYAAGTISYQTLIKLVSVRASFMDECSRQKPGAMFAVIGVPPDALETFCSRLRSQNLPIYISNFNCYGQYSLAGTVAAIDKALREISELRPKKIALLSTSGAWHSPLMDQSSHDLRVFLMDIKFNSLKIPVLDNLSGDFLPMDGEMLLDALSQHVNHPVKWEAGIKNLIKRGCSKFIELGYGNVLTKFGFFIERSNVEHLSFTLPPLVDI